MRTRFKSQSTVEKSQLELNGLSEKVQKIKDNLVLEIKGSVEGASSELKGRIIEANDKINKLQTNIDEQSKANNEISRKQEENVREFRNLSSNSTNRGNLI